MPDDLGGASVLHNERFFRSLSRRRLVAVKTSKQAGHFVALDVREVIHLDERVRIDDTIRRHLSPSVPTWDVLLSTRRWRDRSPSF